ncbi:MAG: O-antigen ligase family protein [Bacteroidales bacterium]|nr:O-antigen ligase family protein [Bacteroidales bacterium]
MKKFSFSIVETIQLTFLIISVLIILYVGIKISPIIAVLIGIIPLALASSLFVFSSPYWLLISVFVFNYYIMGLARYMPFIKGGVTLDILILLTITTLMINSLKPTKQYLWEKVNNPITYAILLWVIYCFFQLFNPESVSSQAWLTGIRGISLYMLIIVILTKMIITDYTKMKTIIFIWSILTISAIIKLYIQKNYGFDLAEKKWLYIDGGARTHIIYSGIRYFSFFNDAATFGCSMGFSFVVFIITALGKENIRYKIYYIIIALLSFYAMLQSGTRAAMVIPFVGIATYLVLSKKFKIALFFSALLILTFVFFKFTTIGQGNSTIRRARTTFSPSKDASFIVRKNNQAKMKIYMADKPFGVGIGLSAGRAQKYGSYTKLSEIPTDSWLVFVWVETGIVGLILYIGMLLFILAYCGYLIMFKLKNNELRHYMIGLYGGIAGMIVAAYANEAFNQFPNGFLVYIGIALISLSPFLDKELEENKLNSKNSVEDKKELVI